MPGATESAIDGCPQSVDDDPASRIRESAHIDRASCATDRFRSKALQEIFSCELVVTVTGGCCHVA
jgi:hypothetical protein